MVFNTNWSPWLKEMLREREAGFKRIILDYYRKYDDGFRSKNIAELIESGYLDGYIKA